MLRYLTLSSFRAPPLQLQDPQQAFCLLCKSPGGLLEAYSTWPVASRDPDPMM